MTTPNPSTARRSSQAENYVRLLWQPKTGDQVVFYGQDSTGRTCPIKTQIEEVSEHGILVTAVQGKFLETPQLRYRVLPTDYEAVLKRLSGLFKYCEPTRPGRFVVGLKFNGTTVCLEGRPKKILTDILELRTSDMSLSSAINGLVNSSKQERERGSIRLVPVQLP